MLQEVIKALDFIPMTHQGMIRLLKYDDIPVRTLDQLSNFGARLEEMYIKIAKKNEPQTYTRQTQDKKNWSGSHVRNITRNVYDVR